MLKKISLFLLLFAISISANTDIIVRDGLKYLSDVVIIKVKPDLQNLKKDALQKNLENELVKYGVSEIEKNFKSIDESEDNLTRIYKLKLSAPFDPKYISGKISKLKNIEWAEPLYVREIVDTPNDPEFTKQYALSKVQATAAWDVSKGDSNIIIAIVDSGVDWTHEDLREHIWQNDDPINGVDDDNNGYVDDIRGWDFGGLNGVGDNDPREDSPTHGTHVAGIASAVTNNSVGIAGLGYNCTIMPVKTSRNDWGDKIIAYGYEGIAYAADNGAKVINCSWGGFGFSFAEQEAIDYAVNKGAVVVAAAGNDGLPDVIYPAAYAGVISVGNTNSSDQLSFSSNYGAKLDVCAPGSGIYSTWQDPNSKYINLSGTSMASPLVAGLAGLVWDVFPNYSPLQVIEQIRANADNIDAQNSGKIDLLGSGRINAYKALTNKNSKSVRIVSSEFIETENPDGLFVRGEEIKIKLAFMNYLQPVSALTATLTSNNSDVSISQSSLSIGAKGTLEKFDNTNNEFVFTINKNSSDDAEVVFKITYSDGSYSDFELFSVLINPTYRIQSGNNISTTITSKGTLAFNDYPNNAQGSGFTFMKGDNLLYEAGLMYGVSQSEIINSVRGSNADFQNADFQPLSFVKIDVSGVEADQEGHSKFNDDKAGNEKLGIETELTTYSFSDAADENYIILKYNFKNLSGKDYQNFYAGIFFDWDIDESSYDKNTTRFDTLNNFGYVYCTEGNLPFVGMAVLSDATTGFYGITNDGSDRDFGIYDGFSDASKWKALTSGVVKPRVGPADISNVISGGPFELKADSTLEIGFSIAAGLDYESIKTSIANSRKKYILLPTDVKRDGKEIPIHFYLAQNFPNPFNPSTNIKYSLPELSYVKLEVYNSLGEKVTVLVNDEMGAGNYSTVWSGNNISSGVYFIRLISNGINSGSSFSSVRKAVLLK